MSDLFLHVLGILCNLDKEVVNQVSCYEIKTKDLDQQSETVFPPLDCLEGDCNM